MNKMNENYKGKTITLVFNGSKYDQAYLDWALQFRPELFNAVKAGIDGTGDPSTALRSSLQCYGLSSRQEDQLVELLQYCIVEDKKDVFIKDKRMAVGLAIGFILLLTIPVWAAFHFMSKNESPKMAQAPEIETPAVEQPVSPTVPPSKFKDLVVDETNAPVITPTTVNTDCEPASEPQVDEAPSIIPTPSAAPATASVSIAEKVRDLILADDTEALRELFAGSRIRIDAAGYLTDFISEDCSRLLNSGSSIKLLYDKDGQLLKRIIINK
jgi:hypothetical protein